MNTRPSTQPSAASEPTFEQIDAQRKELEQQISELLAIHHTTSLPRSAWTARLKRINSGDECPESSIFFDHYRRRLHPSILVKLDDYVLILKNQPYKVWLREAFSRSAAEANQNLMSYQASLARCELFKERKEMGILEYEPDQQFLNKKGP